MRDEVLEDEVVGLHATVTHSSCHKEEHCKVSEHPQYDRILDFKLLFLKGIALDAHLQVVQDPLHHLHNLGPHIYPALLTARGLKSSL